MRILRLVIFFGVIVVLIGFFGWKQPVLAGCNGSLRCFDLVNNVCQTVTSHPACNGTTQWLCETTSEDDCPCGVMSGGTCAWSSCTPVNGTWGSWSSCYIGGGGLCVHDRTCIGASCGGSCSGSDWEECAAGSCTSPSCSNCGTYPDYYDPSFTTSVHMVALPKTVMEECVPVVNPVITTGVQMAALP